MEKVIYLIVKSLYDAEGHLFDVSPVVVYSSKSVAERCLSLYKDISEVTNGILLDSVIYELKEVEII